MSQLTDQDWIRHLIYLFLLIYFVNQVLGAFSKLSEGKVSTAQRTVRAATMLYPSITMCPKWVDNPKSEYTDNMTADYLATIPLDQMLVSFMTIADEGNSTSSFLVDRSNFTNYKNVVHQTILPEKSLFDIKKMQVRSCVTYDPPSPTRTGKKYKIQFKLNHTNMNKWAVTLHNKNHMLTDEETMFGSTFVTMAVFDLFSGSPWVYEVYEVSKASVTFLDQTNDRCTEEADNNFEGCLNNYLETKLLCRLPWNFVSDYATGYANCDTKEQFDNYLSIHKALIKSGEELIAITTGCHPSCTRDEFGTKLTLTKKLEFYYGSSRYMARKQYLAYDVQNLIADIGGYLGMLLGHSMLSFYYATKALWMACLKAAERFAMASKRRALKNLKRVSNAIDNDVIVNR